MMFFSLLEGLLYYKKYNDLLIIKNYIEYDIKYKNIESFSNGVFKLNVMGDGKYEIIFNRNSLFAFNNFKNIKYNGIVR